MATSAAQQMEAEPSATHSVGVLPPGFSPRYDVPRWYVAHTSANHEKQVTNQLGTRGVVHFLPLYESVRRWKDRYMRLKLPLFPGYVFVRIALRERLRVLEVAGVARLVGFNGIPAPLRDEEVECLRRASAQSPRILPHPYMTVGRRVRVNAGPLQGTEGVFVKQKGSFRVIVSVNLIMRSVSVDVSTADVEFLPG